ncbi:sensor histidine kinase [Ethanoligenens harbinense]|uniref:histidine kinase n=1 Tax=Ethanoligenens harbinense (strain DSM 18485 / JCM 12961 / CGMCC 1.5033 / YUAN-3) TaxID=663278 RepID=E6U4P6_ETHHY|nr:ATP-binding protein [Ethanoligenens harbinense]ADU26674.1 integral membrane sensor signal transduction histidine kinase [Ethanoligenens harbinense YUAN-3]
MYWIKKIPILRRLWPRRLSWKLTLIYAVLFSAVLIALNAGILFGLRYYLIRQIRVQVQGTTQAVLEHLEKSGWDEAYNDLTAEPENYLETGIRFISTTGQTVHSVGTPPAGLPALNGHFGETQVLELKDQHILLENARVIQNGQLIGYLQVTYNMRAEYHFLKLLSLMMAGADAAGILFSMAAGAFISRRALRPIDAVTSAAQAISGSDLTRRVTVEETDDELSRLAQTFNHMIERLQRAFERQKRFVSDASHELRTPIAVIQGYTDLIGRWGKNDPAVLREAVESVKSETEGMQALVERLLFLARSSDGNMQLRLECFNLRIVLREVADETRFVFGRSVDIRIPGTIMLTADRALVKQMLRALTDNAVKYTPEEGSVSIEACQSPDGVSLTVRDTGIGIPPEDLPHVFDRFYRVDKARSRAQGGSGLGLAIVHGIVEAHHGTIKMASVPGHGTSVHIVFPQ